MNRLRQVLIVRATGRVVLSTFATGIALQILLMTVLLARVEHFAPSAKPLDLRWGFTWSEAQRFLMQLGDAGRNVYLCQFHGVDYVFSLVSGVAFALLVTWLFVRNDLTDSRWFAAHLTPLLITAFDYSENLSIDALILSYPAFYPWLARLAGIANVLKNVVVVTTFATIAILAVQLLRRTMGRRARIEGK